MSVNIEIKARARDFERLRRLAAAVSDAPAELLVQEDTFFRVPVGRLKLRAFGPDSGELIYYLRDDFADAKRSDYEIARTADPDGMMRLLSRALGVAGVVHKRRWLYRSGQTRIHLDEVKGLGHFMELEYVVQGGEDPSHAAEAVHALMEKLEIAQDDLVPQAYVDLLNL